MAKKNSEELELMEKELNEDENLNDENLDDENLNDENLNDENLNDDSDLVNAIVETDATDEEVVQAVAEAIKEEALNEDKSIEEVVENLNEESDLDEKVKARGFISYEAAEEYLKSEAFTKLHALDQAELEDWFENLK